VKQMVENQKRGESVKLAFLAGLAIVIALSFMLWGIGALDSDLWVGVALLAAAPVAIAVAIWVFLRERKKIASGLPMQDERSKGIFQKATSYSFYTTMYFALALSFLIDEPALKDLMTAERALMMVLAETVLACFVFLGYFHLKGVPE